MKNYILLFAISFLLCGNTKGQNIKIESHKIELSKLSICDSTFMKSLMNNVLQSDSDKMGIESSFYLIYSGEKSDSVQCCDVVVTRLPLNKVYDLRNQGFFRINNALFIVRGRDLESIFSLTDIKEEFCYKTKLIEMRGKFFDYDSLYPQEYPTWMFVFSNRELIFKEAFWTQ